MKNIFLEQSRRDKDLRSPHKASAVMWGVAQRCLMVILVALCTIQLQAQVFVSASAPNDDGDGLSWETAKQTIPAALALLVDSASGTGSGDIFVKVGQYATTAEMVIPAGVSLRGGYKADSYGTDTTQHRFPGVNSHWTDATYCTIISGAGNHRVARVSGLISGCVVRNGFTDGFAGGLLIDGGTASHCVIKECDAIDALDGNAQGGGVYLRNNAYLLNCVVTDNRADDGAAVAGSGSTLINNTITNNHPIGCGPVMDYDGNIYQTVVIGEQCWMRENLRTTHYRDGVSIPLYVPGNDTYGPFRLNGYDSYLTAAMLEKFGYLYTGLVVKGLAPSTSNGIYNMPITDWDTITTCGINICDNGGENGNYANNCHGYLVVRPGQEGQMMSLIGSYETESCCDKIYVYDGIGTDNVLLGTFSGTGIISVSSTVGPLTIHFHSDGGSQYSGFKLEAKCGADSLHQICPEGWHVPTDAEWTQMTNYVGTQPRFRCDNNTSYIAKSLSSKTEWNNYYYNCNVGYQPARNNATWFTAYPSGYARRTSTNYEYNSYRSYAGWWSSTMQNSNNIWLREYNNSSDAVTRQNHGLMEYSYAIRCIKDN